ncbi:DUF4267 domain-containing protein [Nocardia blacklockiae]|uniref:DUF4267 domain-containing protein n=1 Tax=Nocardia blacklockiae TaxID=480036 RepID=UPI00189379EF|nr:DUF4267 domain-containing protein [Nocardia blacklockiae]MBF6174195.1 DUF4267 domain-containing protein [Nocardia blacklockiae]
MSRKTFNTILAATVVLFTFYLAISFIATPASAAAGFGLPHLPAGDGGGFLVVKGSRELAMGLGMGVLLVTGRRHALGWVVLMTAVAPFGDMIIVLTHHGSTATALGVHGLTSVLIAVTGLLILRESKAPEAQATPAHATQLA